MKYVTAGPIGIRFIWIISALFFLAGGCTPFKTIPIIIKEIPVVVKPDTDHIQRIQRIAKIKTLEEQALDTLIKVRQRIKNNPESAFKGSIKVIDVILEYADSVKTNLDKFDDNKLDAFSIDIQIINENMSRFNDLTLQSDIAFSLGSYALPDLSEHARLESEIHVNKIIKLVLDLKGRYPDRIIKITHSITGYTDSVGFRYKSPLIDKLLIVGGLSKPLFEDNIDKRRYLNQVLSLLRAETIGNYIKQLLAARMGTEDSIVSVIKGRGEAFPNEFETPPYEIKDNRRRICIISPLVEVVI